MSATEEDGLDVALAELGFVGNLHDPTAALMDMLASRGWHAPGSMEHDETCRSCPRWTAWGKDSVADSWVPIPLRWRHVIAGDVIIGEDGRLWMIAETAAGRRDVVHAIAGTAEHTADVDPDDVVQVLVPSGERAAIKAAREGLDGRIICRSAPL